MKQQNPHGNSRSPLLPTPQELILPANGTNPSSKRGTNSNDNMKAVVTFGGVSISTFANDTQGTILTDNNRSSILSTPTRQARLDDKVAFLEEIIPQMFWMTTKAKQRIAQSFKERVFLADQVLIKEGEKPRSIMLIREGDCELFSSRNPLKYELTENG